MKKLLVLSVCCMASVAMAGPGFDLPDGPINMAPGESADIAVGVAGTGTAMAMELYLEVDGPVEIADLNIDGNAAGTAPGQSPKGSVFDTNTTGAIIYTNAREPGIVPVPQLAVGYVTTAVGSVNLSPGVRVATISVYVPMGTPDADYVLTTNSASLGVPSNWGDGDYSVGQDSVIIRVPEPVTALLLLAGIPLLRRRHA